MFEMKLVFNDEQVSFLKNVGTTSVSEFEKSISRSALLIQSYAKINIQRGIRSGRTYKRRGTEHQASAPGEFPKSDTGHLASSIRIDFRPLQADIGSDLPYAEFLETGTTNKSKALALLSAKTLRTNSLFLNSSYRMAPRPWLQPSFDANAEKMRSIFDDSLKRMFKL